MVTRRTKPLAKLAQINLAIRGLEGKMRPGNEAIAYYKDPRGACRTWHRGTAVPGATLLLCGDLIIWAPLQGAICAIARWIHSAVTR
jgi:hypothetical protein